MWIGVMRLLRDDDLLGRLLLHEDIALQDSLGTSGDDKCSLALITNRGITVANDADLPIADACGRLQADP